MTCPLGRYLPNLPAQQFHIVSFDNVGRHQHAGLLRRKRARSPTDPQFPLEELFFAAFVNHARAPHRLDIGEGETLLAGQQRRGGVSGISHSAVVAQFYATFTRVAASGRSVPNARW